YHVHKATLREGCRPRVWKAQGAKEQRMVYGVRGATLEPVAEELRERFSLRDDEVRQLATWAMRIEEHYAGKRGSDSPMDVEWGKDGESGQLFVLQARPETVHSNRKGASLRIYKLTGKGEQLAQGFAVGEGIAVGTAR